VPTLFVQEPCTRAGWKTVSRALACRALQCLSSAYKVRGHRSVRSPVARLGLMGHLRNSFGAIAPCSPLQVRVCTLCSNGFSVRGIPDGPPLFPMFNPRESCLVFLRWCPSVLRAHRAAAAVWFCRLSQVVSYLLLRTWRIIRHASGGCPLQELFFCKHTPSTREVAIPCSLGRSVCVSKEYLKQYSANARLQMSALALVIWRCCCPLLLVQHQVLLYSTKLYFISTMSFPCAAPSVTCLAPCLFRLHSRALTHLLTSVAPRFGERQPKLSGHQFGNLVKAVR